MAEHFISYNIHNGIIGIKHEGKHIKNRKRLRKPVIEMQVGEIQLMVLFLCVQSAPLSSV